MNPMRDLLSQLPLGDKPIIYFDTTPQIVQLM